MTALPDLQVLMHGTIAARLSAADGTLRLAYHADYMDAPPSVPLSLSMPFTDRPYGHSTVERWLRSLLPDNPSVLSRWYRREGVPQHSPFGLLSTGVGLDCAGAVQFCPLGHEDRLAARASGIDMLCAAALERELEAVVGDPEAWHSDSIEPYFSLGGFQSKIALHCVEGGWGRPYGSVPTTHIIKPRARPARMVAIAEHLCLAAGRHLGLDTASSSLEQHRPATALVVERYDRARHSDGHWARIHQEDMCQALGLDGSRKYEHSGGPGMSEIGDLLWQHSTQPDDDVRSFADALVYSWLVINRDAHARNYSLLHAPGSVRLAPLYDVNSSLMFRRRRIGEANMAMRYGTTFTVYSAGSKRALPDMAARLRLPADELVARAAELAARLPNAMASAIHDLPGDMHTAPEINEFMGSIERRSAECTTSISNAAISKASISAASADIGRSSQPFKP